MALTSVKRKLF